MGKDLEKSVDGVSAIKGDMRKYYGKYVAISSLKQGKVIAYGRSHVRVTRKAVDKVGQGNLLLVRVSSPEETEAYMKK